MKKYFYERYQSIISIKLITNQETGRSKGYGFIEFTNYKEFQTAMSQKDPIIFGKQKLVFNSAKNKYDNDDEINILNNTNHLNEIKLKSNSDNSFNENESCDTAGSNAIISRDSNLSNNSNNNTIINNEMNNNNYLTDVIRENKFIKNKNIGGFLLANNKTPDINKIYKEEDSQDLLTLQIKYALKKMEKEYFFRNKIENNNNYNYCEYFFSNNNNNLENYEEKQALKNLYKFNINNEHYNKIQILNNVQNSK